MASPIEKRNIAIITLSILLVIAIIAIIIVIVTKPKTTTTSITSTDCLNCSGDTNTSCSETSCTSPINCSQCSGDKYVTCSSDENSCSINYPTYTSGQYYKINTGGYSTPTWICQITDETQDCNNTCDSVTAIENILPQIQSKYPMANIATIDDLNIVKKNTTNLNSFYTVGALYDYNLLGSTMPVGDPFSGYWNTTQQINNIWIRIPTMDSWDVVSQNLANLTNISTNTTAIFLIL
jgi:hypothetical protein